MRRLTKHASARLATAWRAYHAGRSTVYTYARTSVWAFVRWCSLYVTTC